MKNPLNHRFFVQPSNPPNSRIAGVGEQPGKQEIIDNSPFVGPAGKELRKCAAAAGMALSEVYLTNVIKDLQYPLKSYIDIPKDLRQQVVVTEMGKAYISLLKEELEELHPNIVMAIGGIALWALCERRGVMKWRGSIIPSSLIPGMKVVPIIHPSTILPHGDKRQGIFLNSYLITHDLRRVMKHSGTPDLPAKQWDLITAPSYYSTLEFLNFIYLSGIQGDTIDFDIEVVNEELFCIAFSWPPANAISIPLVEGHDYFSIEQEATVMKLVAKVLEEPCITKRGHNVAFDCTFLLQKYGIKVQGDLHDTMIAQKITFPDFPAGLDFSTSVHSEIPYYKAEGKKYLKIGGPIKQFWEYNALDALATNIIFPDQMEDLKKQENVGTYDRQRSILYPLIFMMTKGIRIDVEGMLNGRKEAEEKIKELEEKLFTLVGRKINYNSPPQVREYFYEEKGITPYKKRTAKGSKDTTDADALRRIGRRGFEEARIIMRLRTLSTKHLGTYLNLSKIDVDGRYRSAYNPVGARTGRLSSSENIFDTGGNQQNWPHSLTKYLLADEGYVAYSIDLSQAENRIVAYVGRIMEMIDAFESERDVHRLTAGLLLSKMPDDISDEDGSCELGDGTQSERFWGKKANHCKLRTCKVLTPDGWVGIEQAMIECLPIAQWEKNGEIKFVQPTWYSSIYSGTIHKIYNQRIFQEGTPEHRMPLLYHRADRLQTRDKVVSKPMNSYPHSGNYSAPLSGKFSGEFSFKKEILQLLVAFQADGSWNGNGLRIKVYKERKVNRLREILINGNIEFNETESGISISAYSPISKLAMNILGINKTYGPWLLFLSGENLDIIIDELPLWDGHDGSYFTSKKQNAEWIQTICHLRGKAANIAVQDNSKNPEAFGNNLIYIVNIRSTNAPATSAIIHETREVEDEIIFCPTVPSGFFMCKEAGIISVTGNSLNYDIGYKEFALKNDLTEKEAMWMVERYHMIYPGVRTNYHSFIQSELMRSRTITNLMGRKRRFLDKAGNKLNKEAYAQIPQSTVADIINERGLCVAYQEPIVELLRQVHDDIGFQMPVRAGFKAHAEVLWRLKKSLETPLHFHDREFIIPVDITFGLSFSKVKGEHVEIKHDKFPTSIEELALLLEFGSFYPSLQKGEI